MTTRLEWLFPLACAAALAAACVHAEDYPGEPQPLDLDALDQPVAAIPVPPPEPPPPAADPAPPPVPPPEAAPPAAVPTQQAASGLNGTTLRFDRGSKVLNDDGLDGAKLIAAELIANPGTVIELAGFGDASGDRNLGTQRAKFLRGYLKMLGASAAQMQTIGRADGGPGRVELRVLGE